MELNDLEFMFARDVEYTLHIFVLLLLLFFYKLTIRHFPPENNSFFFGYTVYFVSFKLRKNGQKNVQFF